MVFRADRSSLNLRGASARQEKGRGTFHSRCRSRPKPYRQHRLQSGGRLICHTDALVERRGDFDTSVARLAHRHLRRQRAVSGAGRPDGRAGAHPQQTTSRCCASHSEAGTPSAADRTRCGPHRRREVRVSWGRGNRSGIGRRVLPGSWPGTGSSQRVVPVVGDCPRRTMWAAQEEQLGGADADVIVVVEDGQVDPVMTRVRARLVQLLGQEAGRLNTGSSGHRGVVPSSNHYQGRN